MPRSNATDKSPTVPRPAVAGLLLILMITAGGCSRFRNYSPDNLPAEFQAAPVENVQKVDPTRFSPPQASNDLIEPGDTLRISLAAGLDRDANTTFYVRVGTDGAGVLPEIGPLHLAGLGLPEAEQQITSACIQRGLYRRPTVSVAMERRQLNRILVVGGVEKPGIQELPRRSSYLGTALVAAGGLAKDAGAKIEIRRLKEPTAMAGGPGANGIQQVGYNAPAGQRQVEVVCLNLADNTQQNHGSEYLEDGTVVNVEKRTFQPIQVIGVVQKPGEYEFPTTRELRLLGAIAQAGGTASKLADEVLILRQRPDGQGQIKIKASLDSAKHNAADNLRLAPGDVVSVEQTPATLLWDLVNRVGIGATMPLF